MLSKKMAFSLTSLITIVAFAFVAPVAMAASFGVTLSEHADQPDIGAAPGLQLERPGTPLKVKVTFGEPVDLEAGKANISIAGFDMNGAYIPAVVLAKVVPNDKPANEFTLEITINADTSRVTLMIAEGIKSANAFSKNMSAELPAVDIILYDPDVDITPRVYSIKRADGSGLPVGNGAVNVIITLSEMPASFEAAHINVMGGTAAKPVALTPIRQNAVGLSQFAAHIDKAEPASLTPMQIRDGIIKSGDDGNARDEYDFKGINYYLSTVAQAGHTTALNEDGGSVQQTTDIPDDFVGAVSTLKAEIGAAATAVMYYHEDDDGNVVDADGNTDGIQGVSIQHSDGTAQPGANVTAMPLKDGDKVTGIVRPPTKKGTANLASGTTVDGVTVTEVTVLAANFDRSKKEKDYARPAIANFEDATAFGFALARWGALTSDTADGQRAAYEKEKKIYDAYIKLQDLMKEARMEDQRKWREDLITAASTGTTTQIADNVLPPTGRDGMLHPYSVAITPTYASNPVVVKVNRWQNNALTASMYIPPTLETAYTEGFDKLTIPVTLKAAAAAAVQPSGVIVFTVPVGAFK